MGTTSLLHCKKHSSPCCWVPLPPPRSNVWLTACDVPLPPRHVWPTQQVPQQRVPLPEFPRAMTLARPPARSRKQQPPLPRLGRRLSRHQTSAALASHCLRPKMTPRHGLRKLRALPPPPIRRTPLQPRPTSLQPHGRNSMASICKPSSQSGCPLCRACRHFCGPAYGKPTPSLSEPCAMHTRERARYNKPELGNCSYWSRACFSAAHGLRAQPDARRCSNECATSLPGAGLLCSQQRAMLQTSTALPQQPMPTMMTLRASDAGRPPARTSAEEKCLEAGPCLQRRLWLRALKTPSQHCPTRPGAHLPCALQSPQTCATSNLTRRPHSQMPPSVRLCVPPGAGALPAYQSGATCEHYKVLLDDAEALELFAHAANLLASAQIPASITAALAVSRLTALRKPAGGVRGIATGDTFRKLVSRCLARHYADTFDQATRPYQFAFQTRAGTDALSGTLRAAIDLDADATIVSLDGRSAYDAISRATFPVQAARGRPGPSAVRPPVVRPGVHVLLVGRLRRPAEHPSGRRLRAGRRLGPSPARAWPARRPRCCRPAPATWSPRRSRTWQALPPTWARPAFTTAPAVPAPAGIAELGEAVWTGNAPEAARKFLALGTPIGHPAYVASHTDARLKAEARLLQELPLLPDLQCAWLILAMCAAPRADHLLRTLPPDLSASYARGHDDAVWQCLRDLLGEPDDRDPEVAAARRLALLPARLGGLGLQCAERVAPAAYWAAWADALPVLRLRRPEAAARCLAELEAGSASFAVLTRCRCSRCPPHTRRMGGSAPVAHYP